jgi:hypothetical protein
MRRGQDLHQNPQSGAGVHISLNFSNASRLSGSAGYMRQKRLATETNRMHLVIFGMQKRKFGPYLAAIHRTVSRQESVPAVGNVRHCDAHRFAGVEVGAQPIHRHAPQAPELQDRQRTAPHGGGIRPA